MTNFAKRMIIAALVSVFAFSVFVFGSNGTVFAQGNNDNITVKSYVEYLKSKGPVAKETLDAFQELSRQKQQKFIFYLTNKNAQKKILNAKIKNGKQRRLFNGDVVIMSESNKDKTSLNQSTMTTLSTGSWTIWHTTTTYTFGVPVYKTKVVLNYDYNSYSATDTNWVSAYVVYQYNPTVSITKSAQYHWLAHEDAYGKGVFAYKIGVSGYGIQLGTLQHYIKGNENGFVSGWQVNSD